MLRCASFNVLADAYLGYRDYQVADPGLLKPGARLPKIVSLVEGLGVDVIGMQEVETGLQQAFCDTNQWQTFWSPKGQGRADGALMLVRKGLDVSDFETRLYADATKTVMQALRIGGVLFANTHLRWTPPGDTGEIRSAQATELLHYIGPERPAVIFADTNDRPGGPVRQLLHESGFKNYSGDGPIALVDEEKACLDIIAVRGVEAKTIATNFYPENIPSWDCPSDHIPVMTAVILDS